MGQLQTITELSCRPTPRCPLSSASCRPPLFHVSALSEHLSATPLNSKDSLNVPDIHPTASLTARQHLRRLDHVFDLMSIQRSLRRPIQLTALHNAVCAQEGAADGFARVCGKARVVQRNVDPRVERIVDLLHPVGREEHDAFVVLQHTQEDRQRLVPFQGFGAPCFQEDVALVDQPNSTPLLHHVQHSFRRLFDITRLQT